MDLLLDTNVAHGYNSQSQVIRILTEHWVKQNSFCPNCGNNQLVQFHNNKPVADFFCNACNQEYELKSKRGSLGDKIVDGAYNSMINRIEAANNPNFFFLTYNLADYSIRDFLIIPKHYFVAKCIERRKPLSEIAKRAGWVGCNILLNQIPLSGRIFLIENSAIVPKPLVLDKWKKTSFLKEFDQSSKGWIIEIMKIIDLIPNQYFKLADIYQYVSHLEVVFPNNRFIKDKIRQQLQVLRDRGLLEFITRGNYKKLT
jgi:type II restriction enzyme